MNEWTWNLWIGAGAGACQFIGTARGADFATACTARARRDAAFAALFDGTTMTYGGRRLHASPKPALRDAGLPEARSTLRVLAA